MRLWIHPRAVGQRWSVREGEGVRRGEAQSRLSAHPLVRLEELVGQLKAGRLEVALSPLEEVLPAVAQQVAAHEE